MASYMDMVTVLMCMFIVLFAMSSIDEAKFEALRQSLATGFGIVDGAPSAQAVLVEPVLLPPIAEPEGPGYSAVELAELELDDLEALRDSIDANLHERGLSQTVEFTFDERGLTVGLVGSATYFAPDRADLSEMAKAVLDSISVVLAPTAREVSVEGHADHHGQTVNFPTDWELSAGRAARVLRHLVDGGGVAADRIGAVGYGAARPIASGSSLADMAKNRRVDVVVLSDEAENVRNLIPSIVADEPPN